MKISKEAFFQIQKSNMKTIPFSQAKGWHDAHSTRQKIAYYIDKEENPSIMVWGRIFHQRFIGNILQILGESENNPTAESIEKFYQEIYSDNYAMVILSSVATPSAEREIAMRRAGFVRPYGLTLCPLSIVVNIETPEKRYKAWRQNLRKAESLRFEDVMHPDADSIKFFSDMFLEMSLNKHMGYTVSTEEIQSILKDPGFHLYMVKDTDGSPLAGRIIYVNGTFSEDVLAANANAGRKVGASYFILEKAFGSLKEQGVKSFDFGRIAPGLGSVNSVYEFKKFSGGKTIQYGGEWVRAKSKYIELLFLIYRQFIKKGARY